MTFDRNSYMRARRALGMDGNQALQTPDALLAHKVSCVSWLGGSCQHCGYTPSMASHYAALDFHHREPSTKSFRIAGAHTRARSAVTAELAKCDLICSNCHRIEHYGSGTLAGRPASLSTDYVPLRPGKMARALLIANPSLVSHLFG